MCGVSLDPLLNNFEETLNKKFPFSSEQWRLTWCCLYSINACGFLKIIHSGKKNPIKCLNSENYIMHRKLKLSHAVY